MTQIYSEINNSWQKWTIMYWYQLSKMVVKIA